MGLDQYASSRKTKPATPIDFENASADIVNGDLHYWRKHPNLHGWMQRLYVEKGGEGDPSAFNCVALELTAEDLDRLEVDIKTGKLPDTSGFFFGQSTGAGDEVHDDLEFIRKAREAIAAGEFPFYSSWW